MRLTGRAVGRRYAGIACIGVLAALATAGRPAALRAEPAVLLPAPDEEGSHEAYQRRLETARAVSYRDAVSVYDRWLDKHADSYRAGIERCRLIEAVARLEEDDENGGALDASNCSLELVQRFPQVPAVLLFRLEHLWGADAAAFGEAALRKPAPSWTPFERASLLQKVAFAYFDQQQTNQAVSYGRQARDASDRVDVSLILAKSLKTVGMNRQAHDPMNAPT